MMVAAVIAASTVTQRGAINSPIFRRSAVNITNGTIANGNCRLNTTCDRMSSCAVPFSPNQMVTIAAGRIAMARVSSGRAQAGRRLLINPAITIWPERQAVAAVYEIDDYSEDQHH